ncbi:MAG: glycosyltransferase [Cetobacterium sp.]
MKIYFLIENYYNIGGREKILEELANDLAKYCEIIIINIDIDIKKRSLNTDKIKIIDLEIKEKNYIKYWKIIKKLNEILENESSGFIVGVGSWNGMLLPLLKNKKIKKISSEHGSYRGASLKIKLFRKMTYPFLDNIISLTEEDLKKYYKKLNKNSLVISNFIEIQDEADLENKIIVFAGRLEKGKGLEDLIEIWRIVESQNKEWVLKVFGDGELRTEIEEKIKLYNLKNIHLLGFVDDIKDRLKSASLIVLPSYSEGMPMILLEGLSLGIPLISYDCETGPSEIISNEKTGFLVPVGNIQEFSKKIIELIENRELILEMKKNSLETRKKFSKNKIVEKWLEFFNLKNS